MYIKSTPPDDGYLYHYSSYQGLKGILETGMIIASKAYATCNNQIIHLTTSRGKFDFRNPSSVPSLIAGCIRMPIDKLGDLAIPCLYTTESDDIFQRLRQTKNELFIGLPPEYKYIVQKVTHRDMFLDENEYSILEPQLAIFGRGAEIYARGMYFSRLVTLAEGKYRTKVTYWGERVEKPVKEVKV